MNNTPSTAPAARTRAWEGWLTRSAALGVVGLALYWTARYSYPLIHSLVEFARITVAIGIFTLAWTPHVAEAMSSHRPCRPALGLAAALA
jgi:hypothetical protein